MVEYCSMGRPTRGAMITALILAVGLLAGVARSAPVEVARLAEPQWAEALKPLEAMPVQDYGFVRSGYTFGENHLLAIAGKRKLEGVPALHILAWLMADNQAARTLPLLQPGRPELVDLFGAKRIGLSLYRDPAKRQALMQLIGKDQEEWLPPINKLENSARFLEGLAKDFAIVPRPGEWLSPSDLKGSTDLSSQDRQILNQWNKLKGALRNNDAEEAREAAAALASNVVGSATNQGIELPKLGLDVFYHAHAPFGKSALFYVLAAICFMAALLLKHPAPAWIGNGLLMAGLLEQAIGTTARWILAGRAPLSNMYESFTFAVGGMILIALIFELIYRNRLAGLGGSVLGFIFMVLAHKAPIFDSQINPLMPALQSSWLTYHVVTIMLSYSAFALSFFVSLCYLLKEVLGGDQSGLGMIRRLPSLKALDFFNYKIIAVGFPLLTVGIVLGAVWAATAWGRPWGFDPKETWSAITWLIYAIYLHVRYLAGWRGRRATILALIGFAAVLFTYFGVNYLLAGLHSYV